MQMAPFLQEKKKFIFTTFWVQSEHSHYKAEKVDIVMFSMQLVSCNILLLKAEFLRGIL